jgi:myo-inositol-1-phosphate synthase
VEFTPSTGFRLPALVELARRHAVPYAGHDGKAGETLVKSVLAPMFAMRYLRVRTWSGTNLLGGCDSALAAPLVLDLARLAAAAHRAGRHSPHTDLAFFFKDRVGPAPHALPDQWAALVAFVQGLAAAS